MPERSPRLSPAARGHARLAWPARFLPIGRALDVTAAPGALAADAAVVAAALALSLWTVLDPASPLRPHGGATAVLLAVPALALAARRRAPVAVAWITAGLPALLWLAERVSPGLLVRTGASGGLTPLIWWPPTLPFAAYAVMAFPRDGARPAWVRGLPVAALALAIGGAGDAMPAGGLRRVSTGDTDPVNAMILRSLVVLAGGALLGLYVAARRRLLQGLTERAERAERERYLLAERARVQERTRLAAEMHDVVAHRVSLMVLRAGALRVRAQDEETRAAAEELRSDGCQALDELRDVIGLLRRGRGAATTGDEPPDLAGLVAESAAVGTPVELAERGGPRALSPAVARIAYHVVRESLTNARKHAPGARVKVDVRYRADGVRLAVANAAPAGGPDAVLSARGSGQGLAGLRERVETIGGTFAAGPAAGGFRVEASLPAYVPLPEPDHDPVG